MIHVFLPPADIVMDWPLPSCEERSAATAGLPTCVIAPTAVAGTKLPETALGDTAPAAAEAELARLTRGNDPRAVDIGPTNPTAVCSRQHARHSTALSAPGEGVPRTMVVVWFVGSRPAEVVVSAGRSGRRREMTRGWRSGGNKRNTGSRVQLVVCNADVKNKCR